MLDKILEAYPDHGLIKMDGYNEAVIGVVESANGLHLLYSLTRVFDIMERDFDIIELEDKQEWYSYNMLSLSQMENGPMFQEDFFLEMEQ